MSKLETGVASVAASLVEWLAGRPLSILLFHRVVAEVDPLFPEEMTAERFDRIMGWIASSFRVMTLSDAVDALARDRLPRKALVITFDDGYEDNASVAAPLLERHGLTATFFIATGFLDGGRMWNDTVIEAVRAAPAGELDLGSFGLGIRRLDGPASRRGVIDAILGSVKYQVLAEREDSVARLRVLTANRPLPDRLMMNTDQVRALAGRGFEIGGHTRRHPILARLPAAMAEQEIGEGREQLAAMTRSPVKTFAYPNGRPGRDYLPEHVNMVRRLGFSSAVTTARGVARVGSDLHQLPRFTPWQTDALRWQLALAKSRLQRRHQVVAAHPPGDVSTPRRVDRP